jgi:hypothetical protein
MEVIYGLFIEKGRNSSKNSTGTEARKMSLHRLLFYDFFFVGPASYEKS